MANGPVKRRLFLPAEYTDADLSLAEQVIIHFDLSTLWVSWLVGKGPARTPRLRDDA